MGRLAGQEEWACDSWSPAGKGILRDQDHPHKGALKTELLFLAYYFLEMEDILL